MPKVSKQIKAEISGLSKKELEKLVVKAMATNSGFYDYVLINFVDKDSGESDLFNKAKDDLSFLYKKSYRGFAEELQYASMLTACHKRINEFGKVCKTKKLELDLIMDVLKIPFTLPENMFYTCFTNYNYRVALLIKKAITLVQNKIHEDYKIEYVEKLNKYLTTFHKASGHLDFMDNIPEKI